MTSRIAHKIIRFALMASLVAACGKAEDRHDQLEASPPDVAKFDAAADRLLAEHLDEGFVVSRHPDGSPEHLGDALIWTGVALGSLDCDRGAVLERALLTMLEEMEGGLYRHPALANKISLDGALGLYNGVAHRLSTCPASAAKWTAALTSHREHMATSGDRLNPLSSTKMPEAFTYVRDLLFWKVGIRGKPDSSRRDALLSQLGAWTLAVKMSKAPCFRIHLSYLAIDAIEALDGNIPGSARNQFCGASKGTDLPLIDHYCGRDELSGWIDGFQYNEYEYRHQRCGGWESPDGKGLATPAVDLLKAMKTAYKL